MSGFHRLHSLRMENDAARFAMAEMRPRFDALAHRHDNGTAPRAVVVYQLFQTPADIAAQLAAMLNLSPGARVLEPSAGLGRLLDAVAPYEPSEVVAVENAPQCAAELFRQDRERVTIKQRDFLALTPQDIGTFDAVIMNPPFHLRADIRHITHARSFLKPGGTLAALCMNTRHRIEQLKPIASQWIDLPEKSFREEGTHINASIVIISP
jgi:predicted RNA methylase